MRTLGVRELRDNISAVLRQVEEEGAIVEVTNHGRVVARLVPVQEPRLAQSEIEEIIADIDRVASDLGAHDASVWVSREIPSDLNHQAATTWVNAHLHAGGYFTEPVWLLAEVAAAISRQISPQDAAVALALLWRLRRRKVMRFLPLSAALMRDTIDIAANYRIRSGDAVYVALARQLSIPLVSFDTDHLTKGASIVTVIRP